MSDGGGTPPAGHSTAGHSLAPLLSVRGGARAVAFYEAALGAATVYRVGGPDGAVVARLAVGGAEFWVADEAPAQGAFSPESLGGGGTVRLVLTAPDPDAAVARAVAAGAREVASVEEAHGWRLGRVADPFGHTWEIGRPLDGPPLGG